MKFGIVGAGAIGCLFAGLLAEAHHDVILITRREEVVREIQKRGLQIERDKATRRIRVESTAHLNELRHQEVALLAVKSYDTSTISQRIRPYLSGETALVTLQNGLGNIEAIERELPGFHLIGGSTTMGATALGDGHVYWAADGETVVGDTQRPPSAYTKMLASVLTSSGIPTRSTSNLRQVLWMKVLINAGINPVTALLNITNGELIRNSEARMIALEAVYEGLRVAQAEGIRFRSDPVREMFEIALRTAKNRSSMLQDMVNKRRTEIDAINGALVQIGRKHSLPTPVNAALWESVRRLESSRDTEPRVKVPA